MSIQLIVYPQSYEGSPNPISANNTEFVVDGTNFTTVSTSTIYAPSSPYEQNAINYYSPTLAVNQWDRYTQSGELDASGAGSQLTFTGSSGGSRGLIQRLSNLTVGTVYNVTFDISSVSGASSVLTLSSYAGTTLIASTVVAQTVGLVTVQFTANSTTDIVSVGYVGTDTIVFNSISVLNAAATPSGDIYHLGDGQVICDLYEDEDIPLTLSVDDFKNVAEKVQSYSKAFNLPATKRNNKIFDQVFEVTRSDDGVIFNPYKKTQCVLKQDGFILFEGYLRLLDVTDKEGEISYNVNLYSEVVALADVLKDRAFRDLDFTELEHDYNKIQITASWNDSPSSGITYPNTNTSGFRDANSTVKYPFVNWTNQIPIANGSTGGTAATLGNPELTQLEQAFRPFINIKYLIDRIFNAPSTPFSYSSDFFDTDDFKKLYMDFNWGGDNVPTNVAGSTYAGQAPYSADIFLLPIATSTFQNLQLGNYQSNAWLTPINYDQSTNILTATQINETYQINYDYQINCSAGDTVEFQWLHTTSLVTDTIDVTSVLSVTSINYWVGGFNIVMQPGDTLQAQFKTDGASTFQYSTFASTVFFFESISAVTSQSFLQTLRGELGQWDFLKGLMTMFNLVALADENNPENIIIEPYQDVFITPALTTTPLNWTDKIDVSEMKLEPLTELNKNTIFKFVEDDEDFAFTNYKNQVGGHLYGSKKYNAGNEFNILEGTDEIVAEPFAATLVKPMMSQYPELIVPALYSYNSDDGTSEGFDNSPRIMYNNGIKSTGASYYMPAQNGGTSANETNFLQFSHLSDVPTVTGSLDFHFGECQLLVGASTPNNLFNTYWLPYYNELYNPNTRIMTIKVNLSPADINTFKFYDTVLLKNRVFRVNKIDYKPNDLATVEFILIP